MSALDGLTVAITSYRRPKFLQRALDSVRAAGVKRVVIASSDPDELTKAVIDSNGEGWLSYHTTTTKFDVGCNSTWLLAAYLAKTERLVLLHDDDVLSPGFGHAYESLIAPELDRGGCFAAWKANVLNEDGSFRAADYFTGPTRTMPSRELEKVVAVRGRFSLSPIVSVLNRRVVIDACKEAEQTLTHNDCLLHPGMLLGTEIITYLRMIRVFPRLLYVDQILSHYGSHPGSGTVQAERNGGSQELIKGYDIARLQCRVPVPKLKPKVILVHSVVPSSITCPRLEIARSSWDNLFSQGTLIEEIVHNSELPRTSLILGDSREVPFIKDLLDAGCAMATGEDVVMYSNKDIILSADAPQRIIDGVVRGRGATCCHRRKLKPTPGRVYKDFANCKTDGGFDVIAVTPQWWAMHRDKMPDMLIGCEGWDTVFRTLVEETADSRNPQSTVSNSPEQWALSRAYTDHVAGHEPHESPWKSERNTGAGQRHNRALAREFFQKRSNALLVQQFSLV